MDKEYYIKKWLEGTLSDAELKTFEKSADYQSLAKLSKSVQAFKAPEYNVEEEFERLQRNNAAKGKVVRMSWIKPLLRMAAALIVIAAGYFYFYLNMSTTVQTLASEKRELFLPDSSQVFLNAFTKVSFNKNKWGGKREVKLDGEAFFKVAKGSKFDVVTASGVVSVLGTRFNVINRSDYFEVVCYEGLVQVQRGEEFAQLPPNHSFRIIDGIVTKSDPSDELSPSWLADESSFRSIPYSQVIMEFERQYNVSVITRSVNLDLLFTGRFVHNDKLLALKAISLPLNLSYEISDDMEIILSGKGD